jgi:hypothetical protein
VLAPSFDLVPVSGDGPRLLLDPGLYADEVKGDLLRALTPMDVIDILVFRDAMCNIISL